MRQQTAYIIGGGSGIGRAVATMLVNRGFKVAIADLNYAHAKDVATVLGPQVSAYEVNAASWDSQTNAFQQALEDLGGRVDFVCPIAGIGERRSIPNDPTNKGFVKPDLACLDVDLYGLTYTVSLAVQQMRRQERDEDGIRGKGRLLGQRQRRGSVWLTQLCSCRHSLSVRFLLCTKWVASKVTLFYR